RRHGRRGSNGTDLVLLDRARDPEHERVVTQALRVVAHVVPRLLAEVVEEGRVGVHALGEVAAGAGDGPGRVAGVAVDLLARVGERSGGRVRIAPVLAVLEERLGAGGLLVVGRRRRVHDVHELRDLPGPGLVAPGALEDGLPVLPDLEPG